MKKSPVLNSPLERFSRMMFTKVIERLAQFLSEHPLSLSQVAALHIIDSQKPISIQALADSLHLSLSATSRLVEDLVKKNLIERREDQNNRRIKLLSLSAIGQKLLDQMSVERVKIIQSTASEMPKVFKESFLGIFTKSKGKIS